MAINDLAKGKLPDAPAEALR